MSRLVIFCIFFLFCCAQSLKAQENSWYTIKLKVENEFGNPVNDAYVFTADKNLFIGATRKGLVYFESQLPNKVSLSHISYQNKELKLEVNPENRFSHDTLFLRVRLSKKSYALSEVEIRAKKNNLVYPNEKAYVRDYAFFENTTLLLLGIGNKAVMRLVNVRGESIDELSVSGKQLKLLQDCFRNIHLVSKDSISQIHFTDTSFSLLNAFSRADYENSLMHCKASIGQFMVVGFEDKDKQDIRYYTKREDEDEQKKLKRIHDQKTKSTFMRYDQQFKAMRTGAISSATAKNRQQLSSIRDLDRSYDFFRHVLSDPLYCPVYSSKQTFILFDHFVDSISFYSKEGKKLKQISMEYHLNENWNRQLLQDYFSGDIYSVYKQKNRLYVQKVDLNKGELAAEQIESQHPFPSNLKIRDGKLYYLYQDLQVRSAPQRLYAIEIN
ncbi:MAG: hypothetical protein RIC95_11635 [Vicingaceae bacterium]